MSSYSVGRERHRPGSGYLSSDRYISGGGYLSGGERLSPAERLSSGRHRFGGELPEELSAYLPPTLLSAQETGGPAEGSLEEPPEAEERSALDDSTVSLHGAGDEQPEQSMDGFGAPAFSGAFPIPIRFLETEGAGWQISGSFGIRRRRLEYYATGGLFHRDIPILGGLLDLAMFCDYTHTIFNADLMQGRPILQFRNPTRLVVRLTGGWPLNSETVDRSPGYKRVEKTTPWFEARWKQVWTPEFMTEVTGGWLFGEVDHFKGGLDFGFILAENWSLGFTGQSTFDGEYNYFGGWIAYHFGKASFDESGSAPFPAAGPHNIVISQKERGIRARPSVEPPPHIDDVDPPQGDPGTTVTLRGASFRNGAEVFFGAIRAPILSLIPNVIVCTAPPGHPPGTSVSVTVRNPDGQSATWSGTYTYP
jgi:hypothetical protein